jgi:hypothetical protein
MSKTDPRTAILSSLSAIAFLALTITVAMDAGLTPLNDWIWGVIGVFGVFMLGRLVIAGIQYIDLGVSIHTDTRLPRPVAERLDAEVNRLLDQLRGVQTKFIENIDSATLKAIETKYSTAISHDIKMNTVQRELSRMRIRVTQEIDRLARRGNVNLFMGMITALIGFSILSIFVFNPLEEMATWQDRVIVMVMRLSLVLLIETFAFFFLRLYRTNLDGIRYFQNELTNIESRIVSITTALLWDQQTLLEPILTTFLQTERNFVIKQGETTIELEKIKYDREDLKEALRALSGVAPALVQKKS